MKQTRIEELESMVRPDLSSNRVIQGNQKVNPFALGFIITLLFLAFFLAMSLTISNINEINKEKINIMCIDGLEYRVDSESHIINMAMRAGRIKMRTFIEFSTAVLGGSRRASIAQA